MAISLASIQKGGDLKPPRIVLYGVEGVGKTTFAASAPAPIFIQTEEGLSEIDAPCFPLAKRFEDVMEALTSLAEEDHDFQTLCVDSLDWLEPLVWDYTCRENKWANIEDPGYGKGYVAALNVWREYLQAINWLRDEKAMGVIHIAHHQIKTFNNPETEPYDRYEVKLHKGASGLVREHSDCVLFANYKVATTESGKGFNKVTRATGSGTRRLYTQERPAFQAKSRYDLPDSLTLDWAEFAKHLRYYNQGQ